MPAADVAVSAVFEEEKQPTPETYNVNLIQSDGGRLAISPQGPYKALDEVTVTITPDSGKKLDKLIVDEEKISLTTNTYTFKMPAKDIDVSASFTEEGTVTPQPTGDMTVRANFTYSNQKAGIDDSKSVPEGSPGTVELYVNQRQGLVDNWVKVPRSEREAPYKGTLEYTGLDIDYNYKLVYTRDTEKTGGWGSETVSEILIDSTKADKNNTVRVNISNGNLVEIFNHDETGFRIPLRITKVNENKATLTGSQFKARKLVNGEKVPIYEKNEDGTYTDTGKMAYPKYYDEKFDGVSEATGKPGDNYFRELTPGIYELSEIKTPDGTYRPPKDKDGNDMKWYFKVVINKEKVPRDANYMDITFDFEHTFSENDDFNIGISEAEKKDLIGKTIKGFKRGDPDFARYIEEVKDDGRSDPARPDAPYKWIHDARVTNYKNKTKLNFFKKDKATYENIEGAEFSLRKAKIDNGKLVFGQDGKPEYEKEPTTDSKGNPLTPEQLDAMRVKPYDEKEKIAKAVSNDQLGVEFTNIGEGTYILEEIKPADGFNPTDSFLAITFTEDEKGAWKQDIIGYEKEANGSYKQMTEPNKFFSHNTDGELVSIKNDKAYIDLKFQKIEGRKDSAGNDVPVESADFKLTQVDKDGKKIAGGYDKPIYSYDNSHFEFKYLPLGRYKLEETRAITKFEKPDPWFFNVVQDPETYKLKIVFENDPDGTLDKSIGFKTKANGEPDYDEDGNLQDIKIRNYSKTNFSFRKLSSDLDDKGNKKTLKDAYFRLTKVRFSMDKDAKAYEYHKEGDGAGLKKYTNRGRVTEYSESGTATQLTVGDKIYVYDKEGNVSQIKIYQYDSEGKLKVDKDGNPVFDIQTPTEEDKKVKPDAISNATGKYSALRRSQTSGRVDFQGLGEGIYQLEEVGIPEGYQSDNKQFKWIFEVKKTDDGLQVEHNVDTEKKYFENYDKEYYTNTYSKNNFATNQNIQEDTSNNGYSYNITNTKTTTDLKWKKIGSRENTDPIKKDTKFLLLKTSNNPEDTESAKSGQSEYPPYQVESDNGQFEITNLAKGVYVLIETKAPDGYDKMDRQIGIRVYEDSKGVLQKEFFEIKITEKDGKKTKEIVNSAGNFQNLLNGNPETDDTFYVINKPKEYFLLTKGYLNDTDEFTPITRGKLDLKLYPENEGDRNTYQSYTQTINLQTDKELNFKDSAYKFSIDGISQQLIKDKKEEITYILEETSAPDGFVKTTNKYKIKFTFDDNNFIVKLMGVEVNGKVVNKTYDGKTIPSDGINIYNGDGEVESSLLHIVNKKTEIVFTKVGKDKIKGEDGTLKDKETPLSGVEFYLEKQEPDDIHKENQGYYPLTQNMEMIKPEKNPQGLTTYYYIDNETGKKVTVKNFEVVTPETHRGIYKSDDQGKFKITNLTDGYYRVIEPNAPKDYMKVNGAIKSFRVVQGKVRVFDKDSDGKIVDKEVNNTNIDSLGKIVNEKPGKGEFTLTKEDENGDALSGVKFTLHKADADETQVGDEQTTDSEGKIKFTGLPYGYYWLKETKTKAGFILDTKRKLIALGGGDWKAPDKKKEDVSKAITFEGKQDQLVSTESNSTTVYPNKAEGIFAKYKFKIDEKATIKPGDYFTIHFSDNVDLDGILTTNTDQNGHVQGKMKDSKLDIIGPAGLLAEAKIEDDRRSITYTFTDYVENYKPESMFMYLQLFPNRRKVNHNADIKVTADIGNTQTTNLKYHYSDVINIDYRGYQNPNVDISSYMLRLDPEEKTFTAIIYYNPWNKFLANKNISFTTDHDIIQNSLSVKTYRKFSTGTNKDYWRDGNLPDSYDVNFNTNEYALIGERYFYEHIFDKYNQDTGNTRNILIPSEYLNQNGYESKSYVIEIKGKLSGDKVESLKTWANYYDHVVYTSGSNWYTHTGKFETWSQFFNPAGLGDTSKKIKLVNYKNKIEYAKVDGGVVSNVLDTTSKNPQKLKDLGIGLPLQGAEFTLKKDGTELKDSTKTSDENGIFSWEGLAPGSYQVIETKSPDKDKYDLPAGPISTFEVDNNGNIVNVKDNKQILENYRKAQIKIRKTDGEGKALTGAKFLLTPEKGLKDPSNPNKSFPALTKPDTDNEAIATFTNLVAGKYTLTEEKAPDGYTKSDKKWEIEVTRDGKVKWTNSFTTSLSDQMKAITVNSYSGDDKTPTNLNSEIIGINTEDKSFRQKITIKAKLSELEKAKFVLNATSPDLKLSQSNTLVRLVQVGDDNIIKKKDNSTYKVEINNGDSPNLTLRIYPPYREEKKNKAVGSSEDTSLEENPTDDDKERVYQFIVDMPYKDDSRIGAKVSYNSVSIDKYVDKSDLTISNDRVNMIPYNNNYLDRDINLITTDIANIKQPDIYLKKVDADDKTALVGAKFELQKKVGDVYKSIDKKGNVIASPTDNTEKWTAKSDGDGNFEFKSIPDGEYRIFETKAPAGYALSEKTVYKFKVDKGKIYKVDKETGAVEKKELLVGEKKNSTENRIEITNKKAQYPYTGGPGVWIGFTILGVLTMTAAGIYLSQKKKYQTK